LNKERKINKMIWIFIIFFIYNSMVFAASKDKPHSHQGVLDVYDGKPLPLNLTPDQKQKLERGESVSFNCILLFPG
jgi:hypothetical protein